MPDQITRKNSQSSNFNWNMIPLMAVVWIVISVIIFYLGLQTVTMEDQEKFIADFEFAVEESEQENTLILNLIGGTFRYNEVPEVVTEIETGTFTRDSADLPFVARRIFDTLDTITDVTITEQSITIVYDDDVEADAIRSRMRRPINNAVANDSDTITGEVVEVAENTVIFTTTDNTFEYGRYTPELVPDIEVYNSREAAENGSALAQFIVSESNAIQSFTLEPTRIIATYAEGTAVNPFIERMAETLSDFHPRASLSPNLWVLTIAPDFVSPIFAIDVTPINTGIPLFIFTLIYAAIEVAMFYVYRNTDDKLVRPLVRVVEVFLLFWSIFGHEPLWDALLHGIFPTSRQLVHPNGTVIEFTAQHLELVFTSSIYIISAGLFLGIIVTRADFRELLPLVNNLVNSGQTVPTIAIVALMAPIIGLGFLPAIVALIAYGLLPVVRNTIAGLEAVSEFIIDSARGMGMTPGQILLQIELPIASRIIMAGIRTSMVINIGTATLGAFVGSGGLGTPIASGLSMTVDAFILLGAIPAALLAILIDYILGRLEYVMTPRGLQIET